MALRRKGIQYFLVVLSVKKLQHLTVNAQERFPKLGVLFFKAVIIPMGKMRMDTQDKCTLRKVVPMGRIYPIMI